jgi:2-dehydro-3-deoxygluconokinase
VGRLLQDFIYQGGVDQSLVRWVEHDGVGRSVRNGLNFTERGFGVRAALGSYDRGYTAVSQLKPGDVNWDEVFGKHGARWLHTGGIFCALSATSPEVALEAMQAAQRYGTIVSYDLNYRPSLWKSIGGTEQAQEVNRRIAPYCNVMLGNEEDFSAALGYEVSGMDESLSTFEVEGFTHMIAKVVKDYPFQVVATTLRRAKTATRNRGRRRFFCLRSDLWLSLGEGSAVVGRMRRRARRPGNDYTGRHEHGDLAGSNPCNGRKRCAHREMKEWCRGPLDE